MYGVREIENGGKRTKSGWIGGGSRRGDLLTQRKNFEESRQQSGFLQEKRRKLAAEKGGKDQGYGREEKEGGTYVSLQNRGSKVETNGAGLIKLRLPKKEKTGGGDSRSPLSGAKKIHPDE